MSIARSAGPVRSAYDGADRIIHGFPAALERTSPVAVHG